MSPLMIDRLWKAFLDTVLMVGASAFVALLAGIPLAVFLVLSAPGGLIQARAPIGCSARSSTGSGQRRSSCCS